MATKIPITHEHITISISPTVYTGNEIYADDLITITYYDRVLTSEDYILTGETSAIGAGIYSVTVTGIGDFAGSRTVSWTISRKYVVVDHAYVYVNEIQEYNSNNGGSKEYIEISKHYTPQDLRVVLMYYFDSDKTAIISDIESSHSLAVDASDRISCNIKSGPTTSCGVNPGTWGYYYLRGDIELTFTDNYSDCYLIYNWNSTNYYGSIKVYIRGIYQGRLFS